MHSMPSMTLRVSSLLLALLTLIYVDLTVILHHDPRPTGTLPAKVATLRLGSGASAPGSLSLSSTSTSLSSVTSSPFSGQGADNEYEQTAMDIDSATRTARAVDEMAFGPPAPQHGAASWNLGR